MPGDVREGSAAISTAVQTTRKGSGVRCAHGISDSEPCADCGYVFQWPKTPFLDEAWAAAEAALPEGWRLKGVWLFDGPKPFWRATALSYPRTGGCDEHAEGQTPADALLALAEQLASR